MPQSLRNARLVESTITQLKSRRRLAFTEAQDDAKLDLQTGQSDH